MKLSQDASEKLKFDSPSFGNWKLSFSPCKNGASLFLHLHSLPSLISYIEAKIIFRYKNQGKESKSRSCKFGLTRQDINMQKGESRLLLSSELKEMRSLYFIVDVEITGVYKWCYAEYPYSYLNSGTKISKSEWTKYDIIDKTYTNMIDSDKIRLYRKLSYKWDIDDETLELFKTQPSTFDSPTFGYWKLSFIPYGSDGYASLRLGLYSLPTLIRSIVAKIKFRFNNQDKEAINNMKHEFGCQLGGSLIMHIFWDKKTLLSRKLYDMDSLYFIVDIEIIDVYLWSDPNKSAPIYSWINCGIINQTYANMIDDGEEKEKEEPNMDKNEDVLNLILNKLDKLDKLDVLDTIQSDIAKLNERLTNLEDKFETFINNN